MSAIYSKIKKTICLNNECRKKKVSDVSNGNKVSNGFDESEDYISNQIIINILDVNNNSLNLIDDEMEESKPQIVTRCLFNRSDSVTSQPTKRVTYGAMMTRFIDAVNQMNEVVLVPSLLIDIECNDANEIPLILDVSPGCDMHSGFKLLNTFRNSIVHSRTTIATNYDNEPPKLAKQLSVNGKREYLKEMSCDSGYTSIVSPSVSQSLSSNSSSTMEEDIDSTSDMTEMALNFYHHLHGLNVVIERLIETAKFITRKYEQNLL
jgi:hypothetical protein